MRRTKIDTKADAVCRIGALRDCPDMILLGDTTVGAARKDVFIRQGEFRATADPETILTTLLGSCVATCLFDPVVKVGGMNHFLLASGNDETEPSERYGLYAMEMLINALLKLGARKSRLEAKLFGGAALESRMSHIGRENARFAESFLAHEGIVCSASSLGGAQGRWLRFTPATGAASQRLMDEAPAVEPTIPPGNGEIQFFRK